MSDVLTLSLSRHDAVEFVLERAEHQHRTPDSVVEELVLNEKRRTNEEARSVELVTAPELVGITVQLLCDDDETDDEFTHRNQSFSALLSLS